MSHSLRVPSDVSTNAPLRVPTSTRTPLIGALLLPGRYGTAKASGLSVVSVFGTSGWQPAGSREGSYPGRTDNSWTHSTNRSRRSTRFRSGCTTPGFCAGAFVPLPCQIQRRMTGVGGYTRGHNQVTTGARTPNDEIGGVPTKVPVAQSEVCRPGLPSALIIAG